MVARNSGSEEIGGAPRARAKKRGPSKASFDKKTIALVYDFDGTLSPRPMQDYAFLPQIGQDARAFWRESNRLAKEQGADALITYMHLLYKKASEAGVRIDRKDLVAQGRNVELYPGVEKWFDAIGDYVKLRAETHGVALR
ncbi:MAG: HAD family hydrolase, partial [Alphaproteobacteria bacterium]